MDEAKETGGKAEETAPKAQFVVAKASRIPLPPLSVFLFRARTLQSHRVPIENESEGE